MCGIAGVVGRDSSSVDYRIIRAVSGLAHRGPDGSGQVTHESCGRWIGLAHTRLAILDLSAAGHQPMTLPLSKITIVFNGEIYNFREIRDELRNHGVNFTTNTDTEVILRGYEVWGLESLVKKLIGMFAFALLDPNQGKLFLVRDPLGMKPLYYSYANGDLYFSSEVKALADMTGSRPTINRNSVRSFICYGSFTAPHTIYSDVSMLHPGQGLEVRLSDMHLRYLEFPLYLDGAEIDDIDPIEDLSNTFERVVNRHLVSDRPIGLLLSGGFDSTSIAAVVSTLGQRSLKAFTLAFRNSEYTQESGAARRIADRFGFKHKTLYLDVDEIDFYLDDYFRAVDQPSEDGLNVFLISRLLGGEDEPVYLHGVGGDELFGGYRSFERGKIKRISQITRNLPLDVVLRLMPSRIPRLEKLLDMLSSQNSFDFLACQRRLLSTTEVNRLLPSTSRVSSLLADSHVARIATLLSEENYELSASIFELLHYSANKLCVDGDVMSMSQGLEFRFPFLDRELVTKVHTYRRNIGGLKRRRKEILKTIVRDFPQDLMSGRKTGFSIPINHIVRHRVKKEKGAIVERLVDELGFDGNGLMSILSSPVGNSPGTGVLRQWMIYSLYKYLAVNG